MYGGDIKSVLLTESQIQNRTVELGAAIGEQYRGVIGDDGDDLLLVTVLKGAVKEVGPTGRVFGVDPNPGMLRENLKVNDGPLTRGVAQALPFASNSFDFVTMGIALRHVSDLKATFSEYARVLKPGGRVWLLEGHVARSRIGHALTKLVWAKLIPGLTLLFPRDRDAKLLMDDYWDTIDQCVPPEQIVQAMQDAGFEHARMRVTMPGAFCEYKGQKAASSSD